VGENLAIFQTSKFYSLKYGYYALYYLRSLAFIESRGKKQGTGFVINWWWDSIDKKAFSL